MDVKSRHHLRADEIDEITDAIAYRLGVTVDGDAWEDVAFTDSDRRVVLVDGEPLVAFFDDEPFLTVQGANAFPPERRVVTVDAGAISFVSDGANVMRPGIEAADDTIDAGDLVAVGRAEADGDEMVGDSGMVVQSLHHVGDELFEFSV